MSLVNYLDPRLILFLDTSSQEEALHALIDEAKFLGKVIDDEQFYKAILEREKIISTGIGMGIAIPHAKLASCKQFFIAIGILNHPIEWHAIDRTPVRLIFMIGGPENKPTEYLQLLSQLTQSFKSEEKRKQLLSLRDPHAIIELFKQS